MMSSKPQQQKKAGVGLTLNIDSITLNTEVFVDIDDWLYDQDTATMVKKKRSATSEEDLDDTSDAWIGGIVTEIDKSKNKVTVLCQEEEDNSFSEKEITVDVSQLSLKNATHCDQADDITTMSYLHEPALLYNLQKRYERDLIYTYTGPILIAINPYKRLPETLFDDQAIKDYIGKNLGELPPHVYAISEDAFRNMINDSKNQSILVTGESGAGKTETTKYLLRYFAAMGKVDAKSSAKQKKNIENQVLSSTPMLEAFGNAKTLRNDNSSRFGKYIEIQFGKKNNAIEGALIRTYLLEKSRLTRQTIGERNYHIFYQIIAGASEQERKDWFIDNEDMNMTASDFKYLNRGECTEIDNVSDAEQDQITKDAMTTIGITEQEQVSVWRLLCAILHLGNIEFEPINDGCTVKESTVIGLSRACNLLQVDQSQIAKTLQERVVSVNKENIIVKLTIEQAENAKDSLSMMLYSKLFDYLVSRMNENMTVGPNTSKHNTIGILDIYGFESFQNNSLEQFCINWSNEKLQQQYNQHIFKLSQQEYIREKINWSSVEFNDNQACLDLIEKSPISIVSILDEESRFPKANEKTLADKLHSNFLTPKDKKLQQQSQYYSKPRFGDTLFTVKHYADPVTYDTQLFLDKNRDYIVPDQLSTLESSTFDLVLKLFKKDANAKSSSQNFQFASVAAQFKESLNQLMNTINVTYPHYIRCIKPNTFKQPGLINKRQVLKQLKCGGILESIRITLQGYPTKKSFSEFCNRFSILCPSIVHDIYHKQKGKDKDAARAIVQFTKLDSNSIQFGITKIFMKAGLIERLEYMRSKMLNDSIDKIISHMKGFKMRKWYQSTLKATRAAQTFYRAEKIRKGIMEIKYLKSCLTLQSFARQVILRSQFKSNLRAIRKFQKFTKMILMTRKFKNIQDVTLIQALIRRRIECDRVEMELNNLANLRRIQLEAERQAKQQEELMRAEKENLERIAQEARRKERELLKFELDSQKRELDKKNELERNRLQMEHDTNMIQQEQQLQEKLEKRFTNLKLESQQELSDLESKHLLEMEQIKSRYEREITNLKLELESQNQIIQTSQELERNLKNELQEARDLQSDSQSSLESESRRIKQEQSKKIQSLENSIHEWESTHADDLKRIQHLESDLMSIKDLNATLDVQIIDKNSQVDSLQITINKLESDLQSTNNKLQQVEIKSKKSTSELNATIAELEEVKESMRIGSLNKNKDLSKYQSEAQDKLMQLEMTNRNVNKKKEEMDKELKEKNSKLQELENVIHDLNAKNSKSKLKIKDRDARIKELEYQCEQSDSTFKSEKLKFDQSILSSESRIFDLEIQNQKSNEEANRLSRMIELNKVELQDLIESHQRELSEHQSRISTLSKSNDEFEDKIKRNSRNLTRVDSSGKVAELENVNVELSNSILELKKNANELEKQLQDKQDEWNAQQQDLQRRFDLEQKRIKRESEIKIRDLETKAMEYERKCEKAQKECEKMKDDFRSKSSQNDQMSEKILELEFENDKLNKKMRNLESIKLELSQELDEQVAKRQESDRKSRRFTSQVSDLNSQIEDLQHSLNRMEQAKRSSQHDMFAKSPQHSELETANGNLTRRNLELEKEIKDKQSEWSKISSQLEMQVEHYKIKLDVETKKVASREARIAEVESLLEEFESNSKSTNRELDKIKSDHRILNSQMQDAQQLLDRKSDQIEKMTKEHDSKFKDLNHSIQQLREEKKQAEINSGALQSELEDVKSQMQVLEQSVSTLESSSRSQKASQQKMISHLEHEIEKLENESKEFTIKELELKKTLEYHKDQVRRKDIEKQVLEKSVTDKDQEVRMLNKRLQDAQKLIELQKHELLRL
ncbi:myosin heavy chain [Acrasis kona]|uniref:Myosin heavy chain n=1 Tax=Acrasis kona TaxID=1008807 RepID=A0AAW2ZQF6_9EUKA